MGDIKKWLEGDAASICPLDVRIFDATEGSQACSGIHAALCFVLLCFVLCAYGADVARQERHGSLPPMAKSWFTKDESSFSWLAKRVYDKGRSAYSKPHRLPFKVVLGPVGRLTQHHAIVFPKLEATTIVFSSSHRHRPRPQYLEGGNTEAIWNEGTQSYTP
jgi:hypothetical protein